MKRRTSLGLVAVAVAIAALGIVTVARSLRHPGAVAEMRAQVAALRADADSCARALASSQDDLLDYNARLDSMRDRVRELEALHPRGVPADSYQVYLRTFGGYNDSAGAWQDRVEALRAERDECQTLADRHNTAVDSLRRLLLQAER